VTTHVCHLWDCSCKNGNVRFGAQRPTKRHRPATRNHPLAAGRWLRWLCEARWRASQACVVRVCLGVATWWSLSAAERLSAGARVCHAWQTENSQVPVRLSTSERQTMRCGGDADPLSDPQKHALTCENTSAPGRIRTCGLLLRRQTLYPLSYGGAQTHIAPSGLDRLAHQGGCPANAMDSGRGHPRP
jgi:hypothetical protein